jgi:hypothetical protein
VLGSIANATLYMLCKYLYKIWARGVSYIPIHFGETVNLQKEFRMERRNVIVKQVGDRNLKEVRVSSVFIVLTQHYSHMNIDRGSVLGGGDGSWDEPISRAKGR